MDNISYHPPLQPAGIKEGGGGGRSAPPVKPNKTLPEGSNRLF